jgi:hypothetical protein
MKIISDDNDGIYDQLQFENALAEREQREARQAWENDYLEAQDTQQDFREARELIANTQSDPDRSPDEMDYRDYCIWRRTEGK